MLEIVKYILGGILCLSTLIWMLMLILTDEFSGDTWKVWAKRCTVVSIICIILLFIVESYYVGVDRNGDPAETTGDVVEFEA